MSGMTKDEDEDAEALIMSEEDMSDMVGCFEVRTTRAGAGFGLFEAGGLAGWRD